ncbi:50S ribosomal protein L21 [Ascidiaceihabitans donghaensis]|uniref:Large ribosomal subunit protein bL21 n=1 Tax=Ascidiaceihabitans donghaensis TaxID=1510460 RepID=A0A2R8BEI6_9RHOB|nr:50S ribosomal protein L21 [Ascidiaceihabitans donghaensis]SPH21480.1 50S ribosomal protein L21 [Ascidiaceihabitans donghaensis]
MFAVMKTGGKQYKVQSGDILRVEKLAANAGETIQFNDVLMLGGDKVTVGAPLIAGAGVQAEVVDQIKGEKTINFVKRRRKHSSKRTKGHRQKLTLVKITEILASGADKSGVAAAVGAGSVGSVALAAIDAKSPAANKDQVKKASKAAPAEKAEEKKAAPKKAAPKKAAKGDGDDLSTISGVGPVIVKKLHAEGVTTFAQIAAWTDADVEAIEEKLSFKGRVGREEWIKQAKELAKG